jgi:hypothetical protein
MIRTMRRLLAGIVILASAATPIWSWSRGGHMTVAYIAYQKLTPAARARVDVLLAKNPDYNTWVMAIPDTPANKDRRALTAFLRAALWADDIKGAAGYTDDGAVIDGRINVFRPPNTPQAGQNIGYADKLRHQYWHFHDTPFSGDGTPVQPALTPSAFTQIPKIREGLAGGNEDLRSYDLVWLIHLVGDIHQPLHSSQRFTASQPQGDSGGNDLKLCSSPGCNYNLHSYWDGMFGSDLNPDAAIALGQALLMEASGPPAGAGVSDPSMWIEEGFKLAKSHAYAAPIQMDGTSSVTSAAYRNRAREAGEKQVLLAGYRLANLINGAVH